jgi:DNA-directed RNA polymerase subunit RPC12/RpoP
MAATITIVCPECGKNLTAPAKAAGRKVRCKYCDHPFVVKAAADKPADKAAPARPAAGKAAPSKPPAGAHAAPAQPPADDDDEMNSNPYEVTDIDLAPRCPYCANKMPSEDAIICLICGYNTVTRMRAEMKKTYDVTALDWILWLGPAVLCVLFIIGMTVFDILYCVNANTWIDENADWYIYVWRVFAIKLWAVVISVFVMYLAARFAIRRLVFNPHPPEYEKKK